MRVARSLRLDVHMLDEHGFEHAAQVESRPHVAVIEQRRAREPRPIGYHAAAAHGSAREKSAAARPMIGTSGAVHGGGAAELGHDEYRSLRPQGPQLILEEAQRVLDDLERQAQEPRHVQAEQPAARIEGAQDQVVQKANGQARLLDGLRRGGGTCDDPATD